jgi:hypothetical protein
MRALLLAWLIACAPPALAEWIRPSALDRLPAADVVILGEVHDNPQHHANQARAVAALQPRALVFEMLSADEAARTPADRSDAGALALALGWDGSGWPDFALYHPIFLAAPKARIFGGEVPRDQARLAVAQGAAAVFGADGAAYGLDRPLPAEEARAREDEQFAAHCGAMPRTMMPGMVEAQRLRDATLARAVLQAMEATGGPVAVITGTGHARRDRGIPAALATAAPGLSVLSIGQLEADPGPSAPFDLWLVTDPVPRDDPCEAFAAPPSGG